MNITVLSKAGKISLQRKQLIKLAKATRHNFFLYRADGSAERYFGTGQNKSGYSRTTYSLYPIFGDIGKIQLTEL